MNLAIPDNVTFSSEFKPDLLNGVVVAEAEVPVPTITDNGMKISTVNRKVTAIPYFSWANRGKGQMQVWIPRKISEVRVFSY
jgi:DUF1680 family protein